MENRNLRPLASPLGRLRRSWTWATQINVGSGLFRARPAIDATLLAPAEGMHNSRKTDSITAFCAPRSHKNRTAIVRPLLMVDPPPERGVQQTGEVSTAKTF